MSAGRFVVSIVAVSSCVLLFEGGRAQAQKAVATSTTPTTTASGAIGQLRSIRTILEHADHDYQGHRAKAVHEITHAIHGLEGSTAGARHAALSPQQKAAFIAARQAKAANAATTPSGTTTTQKRLSEPQATSDQQLNTALTMLTQVSSQIGNAKPGVEQHLQSAVQELKTALAIK